MVPQCLLRLGRASLGNTRVGTCWRPAVRLGNLGNALGQRALGGPLMTSGIPKWPYPGGGNLRAYPDRDVHVMPSVPDSGYGTGVNGNIIRRLGMSGGAWMYW